MSVNPIPVFGFRFSSFLVLAHSRCDLAFIFVIVIFSHVFCSSCLFVTDFFGTEENSKKVPRPMDTSSSSGGIKEPECCAITLPHGVILFKNCLTIDQQIGVFQMCREIRDEQYKGKQYKDYKKNEGKMFEQSTYPMSFVMYGWGGTKIPGIGEPKSLLEFGATMFKKGYKCFQANQYVDDALSSLPESM